MTLPAVNDEWNKERIELIKQTYCKGASDLQLELFISTCKRLGLSPEARQIFCVIRNTKDGPQMTIQTSIDGYRLVADRTGRYEGQTPVEWCGMDGKWKDVWLNDNNPLAARVGVFKKGFREPLYAVAHWKEYNQSFGLWGKFPRLMLAKVAEALALRKAFPQELSGVYAEDEMPAVVEPVQEAKNITQPKTELPPVKTMREIFAEFNVFEPDLAAFLGKPLADMTAADRKTLTVALEDLEKGKTWEDLMEFAPMGVKDES